MPASRGVVPHVVASTQTTARATGIPMQLGFTQRWFEQRSRWVAHRAVIDAERYRVARIEEAWRDASASITTRAVWAQCG